MFCPDYGNLAPLLFLHVVGHGRTHLHETNKQDIEDNDVSELKNGEGGHGKEGCPVEARYLRHLERNRTKQCLNE